MTQSRCFDPPPVLICILDVLMRKFRSGCDSPSYSIRINENLFGRCSSCWWCTTWAKWRKSRRSSCIPAIRSDCSRAHDTVRVWSSPTACSSPIIRLVNSTTNCSPWASPCECWAWKIYVTAATRKSERMKFEFHLLGKRNFSLIWSFQQLFDCAVKSVRAGPCCIRAINDPFNHRNFIFYSAHFRTWFTDVSHLFFKKVRPNDGWILLLHRTARHRSRNNGKTGHKSHRGDLSII